MNLKFNLRITGDIHGLVRPHRAYTLSAVKILKMKISSQKRNFFLAYRFPSSILRVSYRTAVFNKPQFKGVLMKIREKVGQGSSKESLLYKVKKVLRNSKVFKILLFLLRIASWLDNDVSEEDDVNVDKKSS